MIVVTTSFMDVCVDSVSASMGHGRKCVLMYVLMELGVSGELFDSNATIDDFVINESK